MFSYVCLGTDRPQQSVPFFDAVMAALGHGRCDTSSEADWGGWCGWGTYTEEGAREIALWLCPPFNGQPANAGNGNMVAFQASRWRQVDAFHAAALRHGGTSEGPPGLRLQYNPDFYATYVRSPEGHKLAVVCRGFTAPQPD